MIDFVRKGKSTKDATAVASDILQGKTAYVNNEKITGSIVTSALPASLTLVDEEKNIIATNNNILDYFVLDEEEFVISSSANANMSSLVVQNSVTQNTINISDIKSACVLLSAKLFDLNIAGEIGMLAVLNHVTSKQFYFAVVSLNINDLSVKNIYIDETIGTEIVSNAFCNIAFNTVKNCFAVVLKTYEGQGGYIYILNCNRNSIQQLNYYGTYFRDGFTNNKGLVDAYWDNSGTLLLIRVHYNRSNNDRFCCFLLKYNENLTSSTFIAVHGESSTTYPYQFLNDEYLINGNNQIYKINDSSVSLYETASNINISNKQAYDKIITLNNCFYLYFSINNSKVYVYKYDEGFNFTYQDEISWAINSTNATYSYLLYCPSVIDNVIKYSELNKIKEIYTTNNNPNFASLERNNIKYFNTSDANVTAPYVISEKIAYGVNGKILGTMSDNGELNYSPNISEQIIPAGYTSGGTVKAARQTNDDYDECLQYTFKVMTGNDFNFLNYIKSDGNQHIDLGVKYTPTTKLVLDIEPVAKNNWQMFMSNNNDNNSHLFALQDCTQNNGGGFDVFLNNEYIRLSYNINQRLTITFDKNKFYIGNTLYKTFGSNTWDIPGNITLFNNSIMSLYNCKVYNNDNLIMDLYPVTDTSNVPALLNIVNNNIISNSGSGTFIGGED